MSVSRKSIDDDGKRGNMYMYACLVCVQYIVFALNFLVWIAGMMVLGLGLYLRMDVPSSQYVFGTAGSLSSFHLICYVLFTTGTIIAFLAFLGCCGAYQESRCMLVTFLSLVLLLLGAEVGCGVWVVKYRHQLERSAIETFSTLVKVEYGHNDIVVRSVDYVQRKLHCCGGVSAADWQTSAWWTDENRRDENGPTPLSCCVAVPTVAIADDDHHGNATATLRLPCMERRKSKKYKSKTRYVATKGCGAELMAVFRRNLHLILSMLFALPSIQLLSMCFAVLLFCGLRRRSRRRDARKLHNCFDDVTLEADPSRDWQRRCVEQSEISLGYM